MRQCSICDNLHGLVDLSVAVDGLEAAPGGDYEDAARHRHLVPYVVRHGLAQLEVPLVPVDPVGWRIQYTTQKSDKLSLITAIWVGGGVG